MSKKLEFLLEATNFPEDFYKGDIGWVDNVTPLSDFYFWLDHCVSDRNCITENELRMHEILADDGKFFDEENEVILDIADEFKYEFTGNLRAYRAQEDLKTLGKIWETKERQLYHLNNYARMIEEKVSRAAGNPVLQTVSAHLDAETIRLNALITGDYKNSLNNLVSSYDKLLKNLEYVRENGYATSSVLSSNVDTFCELMKLLKTYMTNYVKLSKLEGEKTEFRKSLRDRFTPNKELAAIFNESITANLLLIKKRAELDSISTVINLMDSGDVLSAINIKTNYVKPSDDDLLEKCYEHEKQFVRLNQMKMIDLAIIQRKEILPELRKNREKAKMLKLCEEAAIFFAQQERKWAKISLTLVSDCHKAIEDILNQNVQCYKGLSNLQATLELSFMSSDYSFLSVNGNSTSNVLKTYDNISLTNQPNQLSYALREFIRKSVRKVVFGKVLYDNIFDGPSATLPTEDDVITKIVKIKESLNSISEDIKALEYHHYNIKVSRFNNPSCTIKDRLGFMYVTNRQKFNDVEKTIEEEISVTVEQRNQAEELNSSVSYF